ncbi:MAG: DUF4139 domain-containing protein, partial [Flavobacteriales bacterium]
LSTGNPSIKSSKPTLNAHYLDFRSPSRLKRSYNQQNHKGKRRTKSATAGQAQNKLQNKKALAEKEIAIQEEEYKSQTPDVSIQKNRISTSFEIDAKYTIPSDKKNHNVEIKSFDLPAKYRYFSIPKKSEDAFLIAKVSGWEKLQLLPGKAGISFRGTYIGKSRINPDITNDTLSISLGKDPSIGIERKRIKDKTKTSIIGSNKKVTIGVEIKVRNNKNKPIKLSLKDQVPISKQDDIEVEINKKGGGELKKKTGILSWNIEMGEKERKTFNFSYTVKYPKDKNITNF